MIQNVVVGKTLVHPKEVFAVNENDWNDIEKNITLFTNTRFLPAIMKEANIVSSISEVRRNKPNLCINLDTPDYIEIKWGKKRLYILVGES